MGEAAERDRQKFLAEPAAMPIAVLVANSPWNDAVLAAAILAVDPVGVGGIVVKVRHGPLRDRWFQILQGFLRAQVPMRRVPLNVDVNRLLGGLDLAATLQLGRPVADRGLLAEADGGIIVLPSAERCDRAGVAHIAAVLDRGYVALERDGFQLAMPAHFAVVALDESAGDDEIVSPVLGDRLALRASFEGARFDEVDVSLSLSAEIESARQRLAAVEIGDDAIEVLCFSALAFGLGSMRPALQAVKVARISAALAGRDKVDRADIDVALKLVLGPRAEQMPGAPEQHIPPPADDAGDGSSAQTDATPRDDQADGSPQDLSSAELNRIIAAAKAAIPADLLARLCAGTLKKRQASAGRVGQAQKSKVRGRRTGSRAGDLNSGARIDLLATLRAAAPWQLLRRTEGGTGGRLQIRRSDFRIMTFKAPAETVTIFVVDASGSSALHRLGEAKGAVELMLSDCYARRDSVGLIAFRGKSAQVLLTPTRSLMRAKRNLAALPGGGGTPLASAIDAAAALADSARRRGQSPVVVFLTDGCANVARDGRGGRAAAAREALEAARSFEALSLDAIVIDISPHPKPDAREIARGMDARYLGLPHASASAISQAVRANKTAAK